jgi:hypothetical protein
MARGSLCPIHRARPAYAHENRAQWEHRLKVEDRAAKKQAEQDRLDAEHKEASAR